MFNIRKVLFLCVITSLLHGYNLAIAEPVSKEHSHQATETFLKHRTPLQRTNALGVQRQGSTEPKIGKIRKIKNERGAVIAYIHALSTEGFIITSADDNVRPILGYSFKGQFNFEDSADNVLLHLIKGDVEARLKVLRLDNEDVKKRIATNIAQWTHYRSGVQRQPMTVMAASQEWGPWIKTNWYQSGHYNDYVPRDPAEGLKSHVGCTATSMAQIINYWKFPSSIKLFDSERYESKGKNGWIWIPDDAGIEDFPTFQELNDALSIMNYNNDPDEEGYLSFVTGIKLHMNYSSDGSSAWRPIAYLEGFGYGSAETGRGWTSKIKDVVIANMKAGWPVQMAIYSEDSGHSVILDGYNSDDFFHVNLGWPGLDEDTWYNLPSIDTRPYDIPRNYSNIMEVIYNITPYQGWNQSGADEGNTYSTVYTAPRGDPGIFEKWKVSTSTDYNFKGIVVGKGNTIYASSSPKNIGGSYHPSLWVINQFGEKRKQIVFNEDNRGVTSPVQDSKGFVYVGTGNGNIYKIDPNLNVPSTVHAVPVACYSFSGNANDECGDNDGTVYGATPTEDRFENPDSAYLFDGADDYILMKNSSDLNSTDQFSLSLWVNLESSAPYYFPYHLIEKHGAWGVGQRGTDIHFTITDSSGDGHDTPWGEPWMTLTLEEDYHFVMTFDGTIPDNNYKVYKNGDLVFSQDLPGETIFQSDYNVAISYYEPNPNAGGVGYYFDGVIDDIRIYNHALSEEEIYALFVGDRDGDGVPDDEDECPDSDLSETVVIDGCDSGVEKSLLFTASSGNGFSQPPRVDQGDYIYFSEPFGTLYTLDKNGLKWNFTPPLNTNITSWGAAVDTQSHRVYIAYYDSVGQKAYLGSLDRISGDVLFEREWSDVQSANDSIKIVSVGKDGTIYVPIKQQKENDVEPVSLLYAIDPDNFLGAPLWSRAISPGWWLGNSPAIGFKGDNHTTDAIYISYAMHDSRAISSLDPETGATNWTKLLSIVNLDWDDIGQIYVTGSIHNRVVLVRLYLDNYPPGSGYHRLLAFKDNGSSADELWNQILDAPFGGKTAFGPGATFYSTGSNIIYAHSDGEVGNAYGAGMGLADNSAPNVSADPIPVDGTQDIGSTVTLSWTGSDPEGHSLKYDVFLGDATTIMAPVATGLENTSEYTVSNLKEGTNYVWKVVATDGQAVSESPTWAFKTSSISLADAILSLKVASGIDTSSENISITADVGGNNRIGIEEAIYVLQVVSGVR